MSALRAVVCARRHRAVIGPAAADEGVIYRWAKVEQPCPLVVGFTWNERRWAITGGVGNGLTRALSAPRGMEWAPWGLALLEWPWFAGPRSGRSRRRDCPGRWPHLVCLSFRWNQRLRNRTRCQGHGMSHCPWFHVELGWCCGATGWHPRYGGRIKGPAWCDGRVFHVKPPR